MRPHNLPERLETRRLLAAVIEALIPAPPSGTSGGNAASYSSANGMEYYSGLPVHVRASASTLAAHDPLKSRYRWTFDDPTGAYNQIEGFNAAHVYTATSPRTVNIKLEIDDPSQGSLITDTITVNIAPDARTKVHVRLGGLASGNGESEADAVNLTRGLQLLHANAFANDKVFLFKGGETFDLASSVDLTGRNDTLITSYGTGEAVFRWQGDGSGRHIFGLNAWSNNIRVHNVKFDSKHTAYVTGQNTDRPKIFSQIKGQNVSLTDSTLDHIHGVADNSADAGWGYLLQGNTEVDDQSLAYYWLYRGNSPSDIVILGNTLKNAGSANIRLTDATRVLVYDNDITNLGDRSALRFVAGSSYVYAARNELHAPYEELGPNLGTGTEVTNLVFDSNLLHGDRITVNEGLRRAVIRNNIFDHTGHENSGPDDIIVDIRENSTRKIEDLWILHNTTKNGAAATTGAFFNPENPGGISNAPGVRWTLANNLQIAPDARAVYLEVGGISQFSSVDGNVWHSHVQTQNDFAINNGATNLAGWNSAISTLGTDYAKTIELDAAMRPTTTSADVGTRSDYARFDYYGNKRPATNATAGAVQRNSTSAVLPVADAYVRDGSANAGTNYGGATTIEIKKSTSGFNRVAYFKFDLTQLSAIGTAKLRLYGGGAVANVAAFAVPDDTWTESGLTWNNKPAISGTALSTVAVTAASGWHEWDLTSYLQAEKAAGASHASIQLAAVTDMGSNPQLIFSSKEAATDRPELIIS